VAGSPFQYTVGRATAGGAHKVDFGGVGVDKGQVGMKSKRLPQLFPVIFLQTTYNGKASDGSSYSIFMPKCRLD